MYEVEFNTLLPQFYELLLDNTYVHSHGQVNTLPILNSYLKNYKGKTCILIKAKLESQWGNYITFTISYDNIYLTPVCHLRVLKDTNGEEIIVSHIVSRDIQYETHPVFQDIWLTIHPCETAQTMENLQKKGLDYLTSWFNFYGIPCVFPQVLTRVE